MIASVDRERRRSSANLVQNGHVMHFNQSMHNVIESNQVDRAERLFAEQRRHDDTILNRFTPMLHTPSQIACKSRSIASIAFVYALHPVSDRSSGFENCNPAACASKRQCIISGNSRSTVQPIVGCTTLKMSNWMGGWASHSPFHSPYHRRRLQRRVRIVNNWMTLNALHVWLPTYNYPFGIRPRCGR